MKTEIKQDKRQRRMNEYAWLTKESLNEGHTEQMRGLFWNDQFYGHLSLSIGNQDAHAYSDFDYFYSEKKDLQRPHQP